MTKAFEDQETKEKGVNQNGNEKNKDYTKAKGRM